MSTLQTIIDDFEYLDDWEDRYRYLIEIGKALPELPKSEQIDENKATSGQKASAVDKLDEAALMSQLGLGEHLSTQRANGLRSMVLRIKAHAAAAQTGG